MEVLVIGCGLTGSVIARELAEKGYGVTVWERRDHVGGNMYDYVDEHGFLVQKYGPHTFHTNKKELVEYLSRFEEWDEYKLTCGAVWDGKYTPTPFNFSTIDTFFEHERAEHLRKKLSKVFEGRETASVIEVLENPDEEIRAYAEYLFKNDYAPYTAKQWGMDPSEIDVSVLKRVPLRFSYEEGYFNDTYQLMPRHSYKDFFQNLLNHPNIRVILSADALVHLKIKDKFIYLDGILMNHQVIYTGALDELFGCVYGELPYRSLRFEWHYSPKDSFQPAPVVAYPQESGYTRITEYKKLPVQDRVGTSYALEYPLPYQPGKKLEPYYPVPNAENEVLYRRYKMMADKVPNLICCGRLADYKYYYMDQALERALDISRIILGEE